MMSYFAFGIVIGNVAGQSPLASMLPSLRNCARRAGLSMTFGGDREPAILAEMRGGLMAADGVAFFCLGDPGADTSDALISPHVAGIQGAEHGLVTIAAWVRCVVQEAGHCCVHLWLTEGWDDTFEEWKCLPHQLDELLLRRLKEENDIPSIKIEIEQSGVT